MLLDLLQRWNRYAINRGRTAEFENLKPRFDPCLLAHANTPRTARLILRFGAAQFSFVGGFFYRLESLRQKRHELIGR